MAVSHKQGRAPKVLPWCCVLAFLVSVVLSGCSGGGSSPSPAPTPAPGPEATPPPSATSSTSPPAGGAEAAAPAAAGPQEKPWPETLPDDISQWSTNEHFFKRDGKGTRSSRTPLTRRPSSAREGNSAKIEEASVLLAKLLKAEQTPPPGTPAATSSDRQRRGNSSSPGPGMMPGMMPGSGSPGPGMRPGGMPSVPGGTGPGMMPGMMPGSGSMPGAGQSAALGHAKPLAPEVIATIVEDLTLLGGQTAKQSLKDLITASLKTDDDRAALQAVFQVVAKDTASAESQELLYVMLTAPELLRPEPAAGQSGSSGGPGSSGYGGMPGSPRMSSPGGPGFGPGGYGGNSRGRVTAADLQVMALTVVGQTASEEFRKRLADFVAKKNVPLRFPQTLGRLSDEARP